MKTILNSIAVMGAVLALSFTAIAAEKKAVKKAEGDMMAACKKEYPAVVKGKKFKAVAEWVETEEHGANSETFKKSKCYDMHEKWEALADKTHEESEEHEHKK